MPALMKAGSRILGGFVLVIALMVALPAAVHATPGPSDDQYAEFIPGPGEDRPTKRLDEEQRGNLPQVTPETQAELATMGEDGRAVREMLARTGGAMPPLSGEPVEASTGGVFEGIIGAATGDDENGMGVVLPILLLVILAAAVGFAVAMYRRRAGSGSA